MQWLHFVNRYNLSKALKRNYCGESGAALILVSQLFQSTAVDQRDAYGQKQATLSSDSPRQVRDGIKRDVIHLNCKAGRGRTAYVQKAVVAEINAGGFADW